MNEEDRLVARLVPDNDNRLYLPIDPRIKTSISDELNGSIEQLKEMKYFIHLILKKDQIFRI